MLNQNPMKRCLLARFVKALSKNPTIPALIVVRCSRMMTLQGPPAEAHLVEAVHPGQVEAAHLVQVEAAHLVQVEAAHPVQAVVVLQSEAVQAVAVQAAAVLQSEVVHPVQAVAVLQSEAVHPVQAVAVLQSEAVHQKVVHQKAVLLAAQSVAHPVVQNAVHRSEISA
jgi:hypothetical protein